MGRSDARNFNKAAAYPDALDVLSHISTPPSAEALNRLTSSAHAVTEILGANGRAVNDLPGTVFSGGAQAVGSVIGKIFKIFSGRVLAEDFSYASLDYVGASVRVPDGTFTKTFGAGTATDDVPFIVMVNTLSTLTDEQNRAHSQEVSDVFYWFDDRPDVGNWGNKVPNERASTLDYLNMRGQGTSEDMKYFDFIIMELDY